MLCISLSESYLRYFSVNNDNIDNIEKLKLTNKLNFKNKTTDKFYNDLSAVFSLLTKRSDDLPIKIALSIPYSWTDISIYKIDSDLSSKDKQKFFDWQNSQRFGSQKNEYIFQYYPIDEAPDNRYLVVSYPQELKNTLIQSAFGNNFTIEFIDINIFSILNSIRDLNLDEDLNSFAIWFVRDNNHAILFISENIIVNYVEISSSIQNDPIIKSAMPLENQLSNELQSFLQHQEIKIDSFSKLFMVGQSSSQFLNKIRKSENKKVVIPDLVEIPEIQNQPKLSSQNNKQILEYLDVWGLFRRREISE